MANKNSGTITVLERAAAETTGELKLVFVLDSAV